MPLLTTRSGPILVEARRMLTRYLREHHPRQSPAYLADVAGTLVRATLSYLTTPDVDEAAVGRLHRFATHLLPSPSCWAAHRSRLSG